VHVSVLGDEVRTLLAPSRGGTFVDCTVGMGGHARMLLEGGADRIVGIDRDADAIALARAALEPWADRVWLVHADYRDFDAVLDDLGVGTVSGVLVDLGVSSMQLDAEGRGFSFRRDEPIDMRMDRSRGETAAERLARVDERELADVIFKFGEERRSRQVARALVAARERDRLATTGQVASIVRRAVTAPTRRHWRRGTPAWRGIDPATRTFQALRIWVNGELDGLDSFIGCAVRRLQRPTGAHTAGRMAAISFHSIEDRIVKHTLRALSSGDTPSVRILTRHPLTAGPSEVAANPRARSAKLRGAERV
jgi:16S rRNA (cytosine1402-N4)-methyltransferase